MSRPHLKLQKDIVQQLQRTKHVPLDYLLKGNTLNAVETLLLQEGKFFTTDIQWKARPTNKKHIRLAAQNHTVILSEGNACIDEDNKVHAVSFSTSCQAKCGTLIFFYYFCNKSCNSLRFLLAHLYLTLEQLTHTLGPNDFGLEVHFPLHMDHENIEKRLDTVFGQRCKDIYPGTITALRGTSKRM